MPRILSPADLTRELDEMREKLVRAVTSDRKRLTDLEKRVHDLETHKTVAAKRPPMRMPPFPVILLDLGHKPPPGVRVQKRRRT